MCTVSYFKFNNGFVLTSNRDERYARPTQQALVKQTISGYEVHYPKDLEAGGTWLAAATQRVYCLLNGGFENYIPKANYRLSRGLLVLKIYEYESVKDFVAHFDLSGIAPFTLIAIETNSLTELRWDGETSHLKELDSKQKHLWCSRTLYSREEEQIRQNIFNSLHHPSPASVLALHKSAEFKLDIGDKGTVSVSQIVQDKELQFEYQRLLTKQPSCE